MIISGEDSVKDYFDISMNKKILRNTFFTTETHMAKNRLLFSAAVTQGLLLQKNFINSLKKITQLK